MNNTFSMTAIAVITALSSTAFAAPFEETLTVTRFTTSAPSALDTDKLATGSSSRLGLTDKETPRHTETISAKTINARGKRTLTEVVETTPGISGVTSPTLSNSLSLRGFTPLSWLYDGVAVPGSTIQGGDPAHYENIDVLYGTGSVINGLSSAGGSVNLVSRKASLNPQPVEMDYAWSSHASLRAHLGAGGTLVDNLAAGRIDVSASSMGSQVQDERQRPERISGSLLLTPTNDTMLTFSLDRMLSEANNTYFGTPLINGKVDKDLRHTNYNNLDDAWIRSQATSFQTTQSWFATSELAFENKFYYYKGFREWHNVERYYPSRTQPGYLTRDSFGDIAHDDRLTGNRTTFRLDKPVGSLDNQLIAGVDFSKQEFTYFSNGFAGEDTVSIYNPSRTSFSDGKAPRRSPARYVRQNQYALFAEDHLSLTDNVSVLGQVRYTSLVNKSLD